MKTDAAYMPIRHAAAAIGVTPRTLTRWEAQGIIPPATRRRGCRVYSADDIVRIKAAVFDKPPPDLRKDLGELAILGQSPE
jgi:hypothetical protein